MRVWSGWCLAMIRWMYFCSRKGKDCGVLWVILISSCCYYYEYQVVLFGCECLVVFYVFIGMNFVKNGIEKCLFAGGCMVFKIEKFVL